MNASNAVIPGPTASCRTCGADAADGPMRRDANGHAYCNECYQHLRTQPPYQTPLFRCGACNQAWPVRMLDERAGELLCKDCIDKPRIPQTSGPAKRNGQVAKQLKSGRVDGQKPGQYASRPNRLSPSPRTDVKGVFAKGLGPLPANLLPRITCPHCWHAFSPDLLVWVSQHAELLGDPVLGPEAQVRFRPSRFNPQGEALDARDTACQELACPRCHLAIPRAMVETAPLFISVIGAPSSGKSHFLASMTWELRRILNEKFGIIFNDADTVFNQSLNEYEETLFLQNDRDKLVAIRKTEMQGDLYHEIRLGQQFIALPKPFLFTLRPAPAPGMRRLSTRIRMLCMYDNAGEHFQPGMDSASAPGTQHLAKSKVLLFLYDPTQNPRFRERCRSLSQDPQLHELARTQRQEIVLTEAASRVRRYVGLSVHAKHNRALIVVVSKADIWENLIDFGLSNEPVVPTGSGAAVDVERIDAVSVQTRDLLMKLTPEFVMAAEDFCNHVVYIPVSALGHGPEFQKGTGMLGIRPRDISPHWVTAPVLYMMAKWGGGLLPAAHRANSGHPTGLGSATAEPTENSKRPLNVRC